MWWAAAINVGLQLFGGRQQLQAGREAEQIGRENAAAQRAETTETMRRMKREGEQRVGYATAVAHASGFSVKKGTSQQSYIDEMVAENYRQASFVAQSGQRKSRILEKGGQLAYSQGQAAAVSSFAGAAQSFGSMWSADDAPWNS